MYIVHVHIHVALHSHCQLIAHTCTPLRFLLPVLIQFGILSHDYCFGVFKVQLLSVYKGS